MGTGRRRHVLSCLDGLHNAFEWRSVCNRLGLSDANRALPTSRGFRFGRDSRKIRGVL